MENMKLSIIVPIYNVAPYLRKCVDSLLAQDISDYEIILVDDGSTDNSGAIADEILREAIGNWQLAIGDKNSKAAPHASTPYTIHHTPSIRVIHQANAGLSAARNAGIAAAQGDYILFVDSDDYLQPNTLGTLLEQAERDNLDVLRFCYQNVKEDGKVFEPNKDTTNYNDYSAEPMDGLTFQNERMGNQCYVVQFLVNSEIVKQELFTPGIYFEDVDWTPRMLLRAERVASTDLVVYNYLWREGSITRTNNIDKIRKKLEDKLYIISKLLIYSQSLKDKRWFEGMISGIVVSMISTIATSLYDERKKYVKHIKDLDILPLSFYHIVPRARKKVKIINYSIDAAVLLLHIRSILL